MVKPQDLLALLTGVLYNRGEVRRPRELHLGSCLLIQVQNMADSNGISVVPIPTQRENVKNLVGVEGFKVGLSPKAKTRN